MISVAEAQVEIPRRLRPLAASEVPLSPNVLGCVLAEDVVSDLDMPPFDKAMMDGYAIRAADLSTGRATLEVVAEIRAGQADRLSLAAGQAMRIATGALIPSGADAVVVVEQTNLLASDRVQIDDRPAKPGQHIVKRGRELRDGQVVLTAGTALNPAALGLLAMVGRTSVRAVPTPRVAVLATGDELVEAGERPVGSQIRNSNGPMLAALVKQAGAEPIYLGIARDNTASLGALVEQGLQADVLILAGGVSAGHVDLVPSVLREHGVTAHFHKVALKPGKPVLFGTTASGRAVFGLPGNPVSSLVCFALFVRTALRWLAGYIDPQPKLINARLDIDFAHKSDRPTYYPARYEETEAGRIVRPQAWLGSSDLGALAHANGFIVLPAGDTTIARGSIVHVLPL